MPIRVQMPNGTVRPFREGTPKSVIRRAIADMLADMKASGDYDGCDFSAFEPKAKAPRKVEVTQFGPTRIARPDEIDPGLGAHAIPNLSGIGINVAPATPAQTASPGLNGHGYNPASGDPIELARAMFGEASNTPEDYGAIGWSMVNRVGQSQYGMTLNDVLRKPNAFSIFNNGGSAQYNLSAHPDQLTGPNLRSWNQAVAIAKGILDGSIPDPTGGATFFFSSNTWDGINKNAPGDFGRMLQGGSISASPYSSQSKIGTKNYFFVEKPRK